MPISGATVMAGATGITVTAGTSKTYSPNGVVVPSGIQIADTAETDYRIRKNMTFKNRQPTLDSLGVYSKDKKGATYVQPKILASGKTVFNLIRVEREVHPESTAAEALELNYIAAQLVSDPDFASLWSVGSLS